MKATLITSDLLDTISQEASTSDRLRKNYNFHQTNEDECHRLLNAVEPGTYVQPHRHEDKDEAMVMVRGKMGLVLFDETGIVTDCVVLQAGSDCFGIDIPRGTFHTLVSLENRSVFFESKAGPYRALLDSEIGHFAPAANDPAAEGFLIQMQSLFD